MTYGLGARALVEATGGAIVHACRARECGMNTHGAVHACRAREVCMRARAHEPRALQSDKSLVQRCNLIKAW